MHTEKEQLELIRAENAGCKIFRCGGLYHKTKGVWAFQNYKYRIELKKLKDAEWPDDDAYDVMRVHNGKLIIHCEPKEGVYQYPESIIKHFYEDTDEVRTRETLKNINDIDWTKAPPWASCVVVNQYGSAVWVEMSSAEPNCHGYWTSCGGSCAIIGKGFDASDWMNSKRMRPKTKRLITAIELADKWIGNEGCRFRIDAIDVDNNYVWVKNDYVCIKWLEDNYDGWCDNPSEELKSFEVEE